MASLLLINGPNLNLLGSREPGVYGATSLADVEARLQELAGELGHELAAFQSNAEHEIVDRIQQAQTDKVDYILLNPGAFTHTNVFAREDFRHNSYFSDIAAGCLFGLGAYGYELAMLAASRQLSEGK
jgi:3-dehydroquinate dehydratase-2